MALTPYEAPSGRVTHPWMFVHVHSYLLQFVPMSCCTSGSQKVQENSTVSVPPPAQHPGAVTAISHLWGGGPAGPVCTPPSRFLRAVAEKKDVQGSFQQGTLSPPESA